jgi:UDP-N-acetylglucosamine 1-carboxyvinyltransferase
VLRDVPDISDVKVVRSLLEVHGVTSPTTGEGVLRLDPSDAVSAHFEEIDAARPASRSCSAARCCTCSARPSSPTSADAASATVPSTSTSTRCAFGAVDKLPSGIRLSAPNGLQGANITCRTRAWARRSRCC